MRGTLFQDPPILEDKGDASDRLSINRYPDWNPQAVCTAASVYMAVEGFVTDQRVSTSFPNKTRGN